MNMNKDTHINQFSVVLVFIVHTLTRVLEDLTYRLRNSDVEISWLPLMVPEIEAFLFFIF